MKESHESEVTLIAIYRPSVDIFVTWIICITFSRYINKHTYYYIYPKNKILFVTILDNV